MVLFLDYQYLLNTIAQSWITQINDNRVFIFENKIDETCNVFVKKIMKAKKVEECSMLLL